MKQPFYRNNIRRGNTLILNNKEKKVDIARKGLIKFFDISQKSLWAIKNEDLMGLSKKRPVQPLLGFQGNLECSLMQRRSLTERPGESALVSVE